MVDYILNKFCPLLVVAAVSILKMGAETFEPYVIIGMMIYASHYNYQVGYAMGVCESKGLV